MKTSLIVNKIKEQENISVTDQEVEEELGKILAQYKEEHIRKQIETQRYRDYLRRVLETKKVAEFIKKHILEQ